MANGQDNLRKALEDLLHLYGIELGDVEVPEDEQKASRRGDYSEIISKTQDKIDEFNEKAQEILDRTGMNRSELETYASNPNNFTKEQWEALQKLKVEIEKFKLQGQETVGKEELEKTVAQERKKEVHRFGKKKHWIPL